MKCPFCGNPETKVIDKRDSEEGTIRRRRECVSCEKRFTTYERLELVPLIVVKKDGKRTQFQKEKLMAGLLKACEKRPIEHEQLERAVEEIEAELRNKDSAEVPSSLIGEIVIKKLKKIDKVAYIRFASVYKEFTDVEQFEKELKTLTRRKQ